MYEKPDISMYIMDIMSVVLTVVMFFYAQHKVCFLVSFGLFLFISVLKFVSYFYKRNR